MTNVSVSKILTRTNCASNFNATSVHQGDILSDRYRVRVDPDTDMFCVIDRSYILFQFNDSDYMTELDWQWSIYNNEDKYLEWQSFDDALSFAKLLDKAV